MVELYIWMCTRMDQEAMDLKIIPYLCFKFISTSPDLYNLLYRIMFLCKIYYYILWTSNMFPSYNQCSFPWWLKLLVILIVQYVMFPQKISMSTLYHICKCIIFIFIPIFECVTVGKACVTNHMFIKFNRLFSHSVTTIIGKYY